MNTKPLKDQMVLSIFEEKTDKNDLTVSREELIRNISQNKQTLLSRILSKNPNSQNKYKRVSLSPIRYPGGKSLGVGHVVELLPDGVTKVVSPFFGGGSIEIALCQCLGIEIIGYEIFDFLCNYWKYQIEQPQTLYEELLKLSPNKETFEKIRRILNDIWRKKVTLDPQTLATYYVYNLNLSYGPGFMGWSTKIYLDETKYKRMIERIRDFDSTNLKVECADFRDVLNSHQNDFLYCDPPYYIGEGSKMFKGIYPMRNIPVHHKNFPHEVLRDMLNKHKGGFVLSYNDCPTIRKYYKDHKQLFPVWQYTMGQGETRIGKNRIAKQDDHIKQSHEILIFGSPRT
jgi:DNA adenine methylase